MSGLQTINARQGNGLVLRMLSRIRTLLNKQNCRIFVSSDPDSRLFMIDVRNLFLRQLAPVRAKNSRLRLDLYAGRILPKA